MIYDNKKGDYFTELKKFHDEKVPIRRGCPHVHPIAGGQCNCSGQCQEIIGHREKTELEKYPPSQLTQQKK